MHPLVSADPLPCREPDEAPVSYSPTPDGDEGAHGPAETHARLVGAITSLLEAGAASGVLRADVEPSDVLVQLSGIMLSAGEPDQREQAGRLLDLLMDGLRRRA